MIGQYPKAEVAPFSSAEIGIKNISFGTEVAVNGVSAKLRVKKRKALGQDDRRIQAELCKKKKKKKKKNAYP